jgi:hypothetical protein
MEWNVAEAREKFGELLDTVDTEGPQEIRRGDKVYVILPQARQPLRARNRLVEIIINGPSWEGVQIKRIPGNMREVDL